MLALTFLFDFYPGGYGVEADHHIVLIQSGMFKKETHVVPITKDNELRIALLHNNINDIKTFWFVTLTFIATSIITLASLVRDKSKVILAVILIVTLALLPFILTSYFNYMKSVGNLIANLIQP